MTDIFHEVQEDVRRERWMHLWKRYGDYLMGAAALIVIGVAGWQLWARYEEGQHAEISNAYIMAVETQDPAKAAAAFAKLAKDAPQGYALISRMQEANALLAAGEHDKAAALYRAEIAGKDPLFTSVARLRLGWAEADTIAKKDVQELMAPLTVAGNPFRFMASELLAYVDYRLGDVAASQAGYTALAKDNETPQGIRARASGMAAFLAAGGNVNVGTVPPPPAPSALPVQSPVQTPEAAGSPSAPTSEPAKTP